jgi:hypothetical protein
MARRFWILKTKRFLMCTNRSLKGTRRQKRVGVSAFRRIGASAGDGRRSVWVCSGIEGGKAGRRQKRVGVSAFRGIGGQR